MNLFLDTSALVKVFVEEQHSDVVRSEVERAAVCIACRMTIVEAHATFARMRVGGRLDDATLNRLAPALDRLWADVAVIPLDDPVVDAAVGVARRHALRGYDAVQLASALEAARASSITFASFDAELEVAATREGLELLAR